MPSVCLYFQVHQPYRLRRYSVFDEDPFYFDEASNRAILEKVAGRCYRPATQLVLDLVRRHAGRFRLAYSISGTALAQLEAWAPDVIDLFRALVDTGACEMLGETSHHSLSFLFSRAEFDAQVAAHADRVEALFGVRPRVLRNTELLYDDALAAHVAAGGLHRGIICEGVDRLLDGRAPGVYVPPSNADVSLLLKHHRLSDDIAFRFSDPQWSGWPLDAEGFARDIERWGERHGGGPCNLFMDYETFGEHHWADTGILDFLAALPEAVCAESGPDAFCTPSEALARHAPAGVYDAPDPTSWADEERDLSAWLGNAMQQNAAAALYALEPTVRARAAADDPALLEDWRRLGTSDHLYYMCTKHWEDGSVHRYFSPYDSPYDAYINFMNVLDDVRTRARGDEAGMKPSEGMRE